MIAKLLPVLLVLIGVGAGVAAGLTLRPVPEPSEDMALMTGEDADMDKRAGAPSEGSDDASMEESFDFVRLNNQFVVPIVVDSRVNSLVVMSLTIQVDLGQTESVYRVEPRLRDALLQVMFDHANSGGFDGPFTEAARMKILRTALREAAQSTVGDTVSDVLIIDVVRQDTT